MTDLWPPDWPYYEVKTNDTVTFGQIPEICAWINANTTSCRNVVPTLAWHSEMVAEVTRRGEPANALDENPLRPTFAFGDLVDAIYFKLRWG